MAVEKQVEEDALHCKVETGGTTASCWFCDCKELKDLISNDEQAVE